jgi:hypothetical protein
MPHIMKKYLSISAAILILASCSSPKYTYNFDYYDYNSGKKKTKVQEGIATQQQSVDESTLTVDENTLVASAKESEVYIAKPAPVLTKEEAVERIKSMSKEERKELKKEVKSYVKEMKKSNVVKSESSAKALSGDVKLAAIFGVVGLVLLIIGGEVLYILGAVALLIGLYFFIRYLSRQ